MATTEYGEYQANAPGRFRTEYVEYQTYPRGRFRDVVAQMTPLAPTLMRLMNARVGKLRAREMVELGLGVLDSPDAVLSDLKEVCSYYERLRPETAFYWQRAREYVTAHAHGPEATLDLVQQWGFVRNKQGGLEIPDWWKDQIPLPVEFQDYSKDEYSDDAVSAAGIQPERFHAVAKKASDVAWMGYYLVKGWLNSGGVSLLIKDITDCALQLTKQVELPTGQPMMVYVIGISEDEVAAFSNRNLCVVGFNAGYSSVMERLIRSGRVQPLLAQRDELSGAVRLVHADTGEPFRPEVNRCYACRLNVAGNGLPVSDSSGIVITNLALHHNSFNDQVAMLREMQRAALPVRDGGKAWVAGELHRNPDLARLMITLNPHSAATSWDAWSSFANSMAGVAYLARMHEELADEHIRYRLIPTPHGVAHAPATFHRFIMPLMQVLIAGY